jgi:fused signal recognition particle receptor
MTTTLVLVLVGAGVLALIYFLFVRKAAPELAQRPAEKKLPAKREAPRLEGAKKAERAKKEGAKKKEEEKKAPAEAASSGAVAEPLASQDVLPSDEQPPQARAPSVPPPLTKRVSTPPPPSTTEKKQEILGLRKGLAATRGGFIARLTELFTGKKEIDPAILAELEEVMISSDVGVKTTQSILERLRDGLAKNELADADAVWNALRAEATRILSVGAGRISLKTKPSVLLMVGVNGVGKTTSIGKLATRFRGSESKNAKKVMLAACDTFRAAAVQQLEVWGKRVEADVVKGKEGADPGAVAFDATNKAKEAGADVLLVDTAGRLHTKVPLMDEIKKVKKTIAKAMEGAPHEALLVLDATTGQNALTQAQMFKEALDLTGIVLTKLDGTAKGGIVLGICDELKIPIRYIGLGERAEDLREFHAEEFAEALFGRDGDEAAAA